MVALGAEHSTLDRAVRAALSALKMKESADFLIALAVALDPQRPRWNPGDVFGKLFGQK